MHALCINVQYQTRTSSEMCASLHVSKGEPKPCNFSIGPLPIAPGYGVCLNPEKKTVFGMPGPPQMLCLGPVNDAGPPA